MQIFNETKARIMNDWRAVMQKKKLHAYGTKLAFKRQSYLKYVVTLGNTIVDLRTCIVPRISNASFQ